MRYIILVVILVAVAAGAQEWLFNGFVRISVSPKDAGIARAFNITDERLYQTKLVLKINTVNETRIEIIFTSADVRFRNNNAIIAPDFNLEDNLIGRRLIFEKTEDGYQFMDDPYHILKEMLPFDPNLLFLMLDMVLSKYEKSEQQSENEKFKTRIWSVPYFNQDRYKVLERLTATISHNWGDNQSFSISINRDEVLKSNKENVSGMSDGFGDGIISHREDGTVYMVNATIHLDKSVLVIKQGQEGRLSISEEHDFILEPKP